MTRCSVLGCVNRRDKLKPYFRFPSKKDPFQCLKWVVFCQRDDLKKGFFKSPDYIRNHTVCSEHFAPCCFTNTHCKRLVHDAVPSLFKINPETVKLHPHHPMTGLDVDTPPGAAQYPVDKAVLEGMMVRQCEELKTFLKNTWRDNHYKLDTLAEVPHVHGDDRLPIHKQSLFPETVSSSVIQIIITAEDSAGPKPPQPHPSCQRVPPQHPQSPSEERQQQQEAALPPARGHKQSKRVSRAHQITSDANGKRKKAPYQKRRRKKSLDDDEVKKAPAGDVSSSYYVCCVLGCTSTNKTCELYPFPSSPQLAQTWLEKTHRQDLESFLSLNGAVPNNFLLCRRHFHDDQFVRKGGKEVLKVQAVPTLFNGVRHKVKRLQRNEILDPTSVSGQRPSKEDRSVRAVCRDFSNNRHRRIGRPTKVTVPDPLRSRLSSSTLGPPPTSCGRGSDRTASHATRRMQLTALSTKRCCKSCTHSQCEFLRKLNDISRRRQTKLMIKKRCGSSVRKSWHSPQPVGDKPDDSSSIDANNTASKDVESRNEAQGNGHPVQHKLFRKHLQRTVNEEDMKVINDLDEEIEHLKKEIQLVCIASRHRHRAHLYDLKREPARLAAYKSLLSEHDHKAVVARLRPQLTEAAYELLKQQLTSVSYPRWNRSVEASRLPLVMSTVGLKVYGVLRKLYALPSLAQVCGYRVKARQDPSLYGEHMSEFVQKQHRSRHHPAVRRYFGAERKISKPSVARVLEKYVKKSDCEQTETQRKQH